MYLEHIIYQPHLLICLYQNFTQLEDLRLRQFGKEEQELLENQSLWGLLILLEPERFISLMIIHMWQFRNQNFYIKESHSRNKIRYSIIISLYFLCREKADNINCFWFCGISLSSLSGLVCIRYSLPEKQVYLIPTRKLMEDK